MNNPAVQIRFDCTKPIGLGHYRRALTLARALKTKGFLVQLVSRQTEIPVKIEEDLEAPLQPKIVIFDGPSDFTYEIKKLREERVATLALDYFESYAPDMVISIYEHKEPRPQGLRFSGLDYILIREDVRTAQPIKKSIEENYILIALGGGDLLEQSLPAAQILAEHGLMVKLVIGPLSFNKITSPLHSSIEILNSPPHFVELMTNCQWAITNGGGCLFEMTYLQKPIYVLPQTSLEERVGNDFLHRGLLLGLGFDSLKSDLDKIVKKSTAWQKEFSSHSANKVIDGNGAERIISHMRSLL